MTWASESSLDIKRARCQFKIELCCLADVASNPETQSREKTWASESNLNKQKSIENARGYVYSTCENSLMLKGVEEHITWKRERKTEFR